MTRKLGTHLIYSTQQFHQIDRRLRSNTDIKIHCNTFEVEGILIVDNNIETMDGRMYKDRFIGNRYFDKYDTNEIISLE